MRAERGQATTETILLTWIILMFFAAIYQTYLVNQTIYRSMTAAHALLFDVAFEHNCADDDSDCEYNSDEHAKVIWNPNDIPEVTVPVVRMFTQWGLDAGGDLRLYSNYPGRVAEPAKGCFVTPCKKTKAGAGTYFDRFGLLLVAGETLIDPDYWSSIDVEGGLLSLISNN